MSVFSPSAPLSIRAFQQDLYSFALAADFGYDGQRIHSPSLAWSRDPDIVERMLRDPSISADMGQYQAQVSGTRWTLQAMGKDKYSKKLAEWYEEVFIPINIYETRVKAARSLLSGQEFFHPDSRGRQLQTFAGLIGNFWAPTHLTQMDQRRFRSNVAIVPDLETGLARVSQSLSMFEPWVNQTSKTIHWKWEKVEDEGRLLRFVWDDDEARLGGGRGLIEAIYPWHYYATKAMNSWSNAGERFGEGFLIALVDDARIGSVGKDNATVQQAYLDKLDQMRARHRMAMSNKDSVQLLEPGSGYKILVELVEFCYRNITRLILGAIQPTGAAGTESSGSRAQAGVQAASTDARVALHQRLLDESMQQLIDLIWRQNCGEFSKIDPMFMFAKLPRFVTTTQPAKSPKDHLEIVVGCKTNGIDLPADWVYEGLGAPRPTPDDYDTQNVIEGSAPAPASPFGGYGLGPDSPSPQPLENSDIKKKPEPARMVAQAQIPLPDVKPRVMEDIFIGEDATPRSEAVYEGIEQEEL